MFSTPAELFAARYVEGTRVRVILPTLNNPMSAWEGTEMLGASGRIDLVDGTRHPKVRLDGAGAQWFDDNYIRPKFLSRQDVFDIASHHMLEVLRGDRSARWVGSKHSQCLYEYAGKQCAVGSLIPERAVRELISGAADEDEAVDALEAAGVRNSPDMQELLLALQEVHDSLGEKLTVGRRRHVWRRSLRRLASRLNLTCRDRLWLLAPKERKEYESAANETNQ